MLTPRFSLSQDDEFLKMVIRAPYCSLRDLETHIDGNDFRFVCTPYYLRLNLPGKIVENDRALGKYLVEKGEFVYKFQKLNKGEHFEGLDFITTLLKPAKKNKTSPTIEVLSETNDSTSTNSDSDENEWCLEQRVPEGDFSVTTGYRYGFANHKCNILNETEEEFNSVFDIRNVTKVSLTERKHIRYDTESMEFSAQHFLADHFEDEAIKAIIKTPHPWEQLKAETIKFNSKEIDVLKEFGRKEYLFEKEDVRIVLCGLLDILFAYCYDKRTTDFESTCESGWTITKLSATLSYFDVFSKEVDAITSAFRRSLIYPLHRNFDLCCRVFEDLKILLSLGPVFIVKCLLDIRDIFNTSSEPRYILNHLYIDDYIICMQKSPNTDLDKLVIKLNDVTVSKADLNLNLSKIIEDEKMRANARSNDLLEKMSKLNIPSEDSDSSDSDTSDDTSSDSDDDSTSSDSDTIN